MGVGHGFHDIYWIFGKCLMNTYAVRVSLVMGIYVDDIMKMGDESRQANIGGTCLVERLFCAQAKPSKPKQPR